MRGEDDAARIRARRCPWALAAVWAWQAAVGLLVAWPAASVVGKALGSDPRGDAPLWEPGGHALLVLLWRDAHAIRGELTLAAIGLVGSAFVGLLPLAALLVALLGGRLPTGRAAGPYVAMRAMRALPALGLLLVLSTAGQALIAVAGILTVRLVELYAHDPLGEAHAGRLAALAATPFAIAVLWIGVVHDVARAAAVRYRVGAVRAASIAARAGRLARWSLLWQWGWRQALACGAVTVAALAAGRLGGHGGAELVILAVVHQWAAVTRVALRGSWLAHTLRRVGEAPGPGPDVAARVTPSGGLDTPARNGAPLDPNPDPAA